MEIKGKFNTAIVYTNDIDINAKMQIKELCDQSWTKGLRIRIMPDVHAGAGCTIGTTMTVLDKVVPNLVGVDIGCGVEVVKFKAEGFDFAALDKFIYKNIPYSFKVYDKPVEIFDINGLMCINELKNHERLIRSVGTLGGGNHFIEISKDDKGLMYLQVHCGSRNLGKQVAELYQVKAWKALKKNPPEGQKVPKSLSYLEGKGFDDYINDMKIVQRFAVRNREIIAEKIMDRFSIFPLEQFTTIHNYIDLDMMILRKGAVSAKKEEKLIIPMNMRDGSLICIGKGNPEWNYSAPHGAGRLMSRTEAKKSLSLQGFKESMEGVYTTSVSKGTLDEAPSAYKPIDSILAYVKDTVDIVDIIKPLYNFKAEE
ncbi:RtcB family protein [Alkalibacter saccharofermentans]|uniref:3'-phosphate/5'-hydroxy nucleic acid ligase n=1 Tax=Alkalibacter saccharofermentans DSM 14828 TaxID=1120975 RepID=A0A1M4U0S8_9FIRM|nr:RtcB family protein [Alkalibacter saccharofermentans]SHE50295.1 RNA-splicing ligase RtcB, repairs tRNA damage [Alkalibacter saccharofermentans DSM 14828]